MGKDLNKRDLYESVKTLVELEEHQHIHLDQHKLFSLFSISFQYLLFRASKKPGAYIVRVEDSILADKITKRAKDLSTRKFIQTLLIPRKYKYNKSTFYLDFFNIGTWRLTNDIPKERLQAALIVKNTSSKPMPDDPPMEDETTLDDPNSIMALANLPENYFVTSLQDIVPKTITIAYDIELENTHKVSFPFIKKEMSKTISGVTISDDLDWDNIEES